MRYPFCLGISIMIYLRKRVDKNDSIPANLTHSFLEIPLWAVVDCTAPVPVEDRDTRNHLSPVQTENVEEKNYTNIAKET